MRSFNTRLSVLFLALVLVLTGALGVVGLRTAVAVTEETEQRLNRTLAADLATQFQPYLHDAIDHAAIEDKIAYLVGINPRIDLYLLGGDGMIKAGYVHTDADASPTMQFVETAPLDAFMAGAAAPIRNADPLDPDRRVPFSVAPVSIMGEQGCYLYVVLGGQRYESVAGLVAESGIARAALGGIGLVLLATLLVGLLAFAFLTRPLRRMEDTVAAFASGHLDRRLRTDAPALTRRRDELGALARAFDQQADTLVANLEELSRTDQLRRDLVANISHDLRSPLASVQGYLETIRLKLDGGDRAALERYLDTALRNTARLNRLVMQLFELSKLDAQQVQPHPEPFAMTDLVQDVAMQVAPRAEAAGITLETDLPDAAPMTHADIGLVERALVNLLDNALQHTPTGGTVRLVAETEADGVRVRVSDTGAGIPAADLPHIFERFYRAEKARTNGGDLSKTGAGLGLAITKKLVELHGGTLSVQSGVNRGTTFSFLLPAWRKEQLAVG
ncbi:MAG: HAMP domain-containing sensor histidine kinase [Bacteroidota bacterium]